MRQYPRIYDAQLRPIGELRTAEYTDLKLRQTPFDTVTLTVPTMDIGGFGYRQFVELYDADGARIDMFRVAEVPKKVYAPDGTTRMTCDHVLCTLKDGIVPGYHQFGGVTQNLRGAIEAVLAFQNEPLWVLDRCDYDTYLEYGICDESPYTALLMLIKPLTDPMIVTDTTQRPWKLSVVRMTDEDASEIRFSRNMLEIEETIQDGDFATRLYPRGYGEGVNQLTIRDVNDGVEYIEAPQAVRDTWGTVSLPYIDTTITDAETLKAESEVALALCQTPKVSYKVSALDLERLTGEPMDRFYKGRMVRMIYKDFGLVVRTRVSEIHKPSPKAKPGDVRLTLASQPESVASIIAELSRKTKIQDTYGQGSTFIYADSFEQNCDKDTPAEGDIYIPESMIHVNAIMLKVTLASYRADSKGAEAGGATSQTTTEGGGSERTSSSGGAMTASSDALITTHDVLVTNPISGRGGSAVRYASTIYNPGGDSVPGTLETGEASGYTGSAEGGNTGTPIGTASGEAMTETGTGGPSSTGSSGGGNTGSASGNTGTPIGTASGESMTSTGTGGPTSTGSKSVSVTVDQSSGSTGNSSPSTSSGGSHSHTVSSHSHSFSDTYSLSWGHTHSYTSGNSNTGGVNKYSAKTISISGDTGTKAPGTGTGGSHSHTVDSHSHSMTHTHTASGDSHSHTVEQHSHGMNHYHSVGSHNHSISSHSHALDQHSHGMNHYHSIGSHNHSLGSHVHSLPNHWHLMDHMHEGVVSITIPAIQIEIPSHTHDVSIPSHSHAFSIPDHQHDIEYGIFKGPCAASFVVEVDGQEVPSSVFSDQGIGDIAPYLSTDDRGKIRRGTFHTLAVRPSADEDNPNGLCRIRASWSAQVFISSLTGKQY